MTPEERAEYVVELLDLGDSAKDIVAGAIAKAEKDVLKEIAVALASTDDARGFCLWLGEKLGVKL